MKKMILCITALSHTVLAEEKLKSNLNSDLFIAKKCDVIMEFDKCRPAVAGIQIEKITEGSTYQKLGLQNGDIIVGINEKPLPTYLEKNSGIDLIDQIDIQQLSIVRPLRSLHENLQENESRFELFLSSQRGEFSLENRNDQFSTQFKPGFGTHTIDVKDREKLIIGVADAIKSWVKGGSKPDKDALGTIEVTTVVDREHRVPTATSKSEPKQVTEVEKEEGDDKDAEETPTNEPETVTEENSDNEEKKEPTDDDVNLTEGDGGRVEGVDDDYIPANPFGDNYEELGKSNVNMKIVFREKNGRWTNPSTAIDDSDRGRVIDQALDNVINKLINPNPLNEFQSSGPFKIEENPIEQLINPQLNLLKIESIWSNK